MQIDLERFIEKNHIPIDRIDKSRKYWLVRTQSGDYHQEFYFDEYIAIGWNEFNDVNNFNFKDGTKEKKKIAELIDSTYDEVNQPGRIYNQIRRFWYDMSIGDIVMIPTHNSKHITFGTITSKPYLKNISESSLDEDVCPFQKRRDVKWIDTIDREELDPYLYKMMHTQNTINKADDYAPFIDRTLHSFYIKGDTAHLVIRVDRDEEISLPDMNEFFSNYLNLIPIINNLEIVEEEIDPKQLKMKTNVQSPGMLELYSSAAHLIPLLGVVAVALVGGFFTRTKKKADGTESITEFKSKGLFSQILQLKEQKNEHELKKMQLEHSQSIDNLKLRLPKELIRELQKEEKKPPENDQEG